MDADGKYKGLDQNVHEAKNFTNYTTFSLWDTYRALHPFFNIIQPKRNRDMINSMLAHYDQSVHKMLPVWSHYANENWCMIGYHSVSVIADAIVSGNVEGIDANHALEAMAQTAQNEILRRTRFVYETRLRSGRRKFFERVENSGIRLRRLGNRAGGEKTRQSNEFTTNLSSVRKIGKTFMIRRSALRARKSRTENSSKNSIL